MISSAKVAEALANYEESLNLLTQALALANLDVGGHAELLVLRGRSYYFLRRIDDAIADWGSASELTGAAVDFVAQALINRGFTWGQKGETDKELADYSRVIEQLPSAPVEQVARALTNRGVTWGQKGEIDKALADCTRVIEQLPGAPLEQVAQALNNRGITWGQKGETDKELADYTRVIEQLPVRRSNRSQRRCTNRGVTWGQKRGDSEGPGRLHARDRAVARGARRAGGKGTL